MNSTSFILLSPLLILAGAIIVLLLVIAFYRRHTLAAGLALVGLIAAGISLLAAWPDSPGQVTSLLIVDHLGLMSAALLLFATAVVVLLSYPYLKKQTVQPEEYYLLLLLAVFGGIIIVFSSHFAALFLGLEILSISLYGLAGYLRRRAFSIEAAVKYLILAAASAAFLMFGVALIYADRGTLALDQLQLALPAAQNSPEILLLVGLGMLLVGIGFKLAVVPFHMWTPDVYQGAPAPTSAFIATVSKGAVFVFFFRLSHGLTSLSGTLVLIAALSMLAGNLLALLQNNVKRLLAYSSIAHLGYLLVALIASSTLAIVAALFYLTAYFVTVLGAFGVVSILSDGEHDAENLEDYHGLFWRRPWLAGVMTLAMLSLIGMPLTAGFFGKFYLLSAGVGSSLWILVGVLVISSAIGLYYYLRVIITMFASLDSEPSPSTTALPSSFPGLLALGILALLLLWLGLYPTAFINLIQSAAQFLG
ncbi:MAG: NADH-quinone oxidoreductase subunit N [Anaerolineales bacterium]|jgi:NADH-quinone oxidoreductase subunit N